MKTRVAVQAVRSRWEWALKLRDRFDAAICVDRHNHSTKAFLESLLVFGGDAHIHFEDDVIPCADFEQQAQDAIDRYPHDVIHFFIPPSRAEDAPQQITRLPASRYYWNQAVYMPAWLPEAIFDWSLTGGRELADRWDSDKYLQCYLKSIRRSWIRWYPALVQHRPGPSSIVPVRQHDRRTRHFSDDLKQDTRAFWVRGRDNGFAAGGITADRLAATRRHRPPPAEA